MSRERINGCKSLDTVFLSLSSKKPSKQHMRLQISLMDKIGGRGKRILRSLWISEAGRGSGKTRTFLQCGRR